MVVCYGFGLEPSADFPVSAGMICGLVAQALDLPGGETADSLSLFADGACSGAKLASDPSEPAQYIEVACSWASDLLGALVKPAGVVASLGCTLAPSLGHSLGGLFESKHEFDVAMDVMQHDKCIKYSPTHFGSPWLADKCKPGDPGFTSLPLAPTGSTGGGSGGGSGGRSGGSAGSDGGGTGEEMGGCASSNDASVDYRGCPGAGSSRNARVSRDGRYVWFQSTADLTGTAGTAPESVYVRDLVAGMTQRIGVSQLGQYGLLAISPSGRYGLIVTGTGGVLLVDRITGTQTAVPLSFGEDEVGVEDDGNTIVAPPTAIENVATVYRIATNTATEVPCPAYNFYNYQPAIEISLDNAGYAGVATDACRDQVAGYQLDLATNTARETVRGVCANGGNACVWSMTTNETGVGTAYTVETPTDGEAPIVNGSEVEPGTWHDAWTCGISAANTIAFYTEKGEVYAYDVKANTVTRLSDGSGTAGCGFQSVTASGTLVYTQGTQIHVDSG